MELPPLESLRFFEAAARHESFKRASTELYVSPAAVAHRVRTLEKHLGSQLFERRNRGVVLNSRGRAYLTEIQRILADIREASERKRGHPSRVRIVSVEAIAEKWLVPLLPKLETIHPGLAIELETQHRGVHPGRQDFDMCLAYSGETAAPRPLTQSNGSLREETLFIEQLFPVCSPTLLAEFGQPADAADLASWPLLYDLGWDTDWTYWAAHHSQSAPDLARASGFCLYSMVIAAAANGLGVAIGRSTLIRHELWEETLVPVLADLPAAPDRCCLITTTSSCERPEVQALRQWMLQQAHREAPTAADPTPTTSTD